MIDKRVSNSKKIGRASDKARNLWFMIYPHLDKEGRIAFDDLDDLKVEIIPYFKWTIRKIAETLNELADIKLIKLYPNNHKIAIQYKKFEDFQIGLRKDREAESEVVPYGVTPESSGDFRILPPKFKLKEVKGRKEGIEEVVSIIFNFEIGKFESIKEKDIKRWEQTYPACDIKQELLYMADWLISNPSKKKSNYARFISNWLRKQQDQGGTKRGIKSSSPQVGQSTKKTTPEQEEYYKARQKKEAEVQARYKKEISDIRKAGDKEAWDILQEKIADELREWSINYRESKGGQE